jgi:serine/alanine adding enzyme
LSASVTSFERVADSGVQDVAPDASDIRIAPVDDADQDAWDRFVAAVQGASHYHGYGWRKVVRDTLGNETHYLAARASDGRFAGVLPLVRLRSILFGDFLVSLPFVTYGGALAITGDVARRLLESAVALGRELGVSHIELRGAAPEALAWPARTDKVSMVLALPESRDALWKGISSKLRSQIKRPMREAVTCEFGGPELLPEFYAVFTENMRDLGTPVYPLSFFRAILDRFPDSARLALVRLQGAPVATGFLLENRGSMEIPWASSLRRVNNLSVNMYLYWNVLEHAVGRGMKQFDFGRSTLDSGTFRFKKQWGAEPVQLQWHYWLRAGGAPPVLNHSNPKFRLAVAAWQKLPLPVANWLGPHLSRHLP